MEVKIQQSWKEALVDEFEKPYFSELVTFVKHEYQTKRVFPHPKNIFKAFELCPLNQIKVVILGQDPYHGVGQAHGLCFSVQDGVQVPPSLVNIYKEIQSDIGKPIPSSGNLDRWASQGVLLLNATLTVQAHRAGSHQKKGWEEFTDEVIRTVSYKTQNVVFMLWGSFAGSKSPMIDSGKHLVLKSPHPSPLSAHRGFFGNQHFSKANQYLKAHGKDEIIW